MFYGWKIVAVTCLTHFVSVGFVFYSYGVFFKALANDFGGSRLGVSFGLALMNVGTGLFAPFLGRLVDRGSIRAIMCCGAASMSVGFLLSSQITALWQFNLILLTFLGLGAAALGGLPGSTLVAKWFVRQRGKALGISTMGISSSGMIMAPLGTLLIVEFGWRSSFVIYGVMTSLIVIPVVWLTVINRPEDMGLLPDNDVVPDLRAKEEARDPVLPLAPGDQLIDHPGHFELSAMTALRDRNFWIITLVVALNFFANGAMLTHFVPHATDLGFTPAASAFVLSACAGVGVLGKIAFGWIADHVQTRIAFWTAMAFQAAGVFLVLRVTSYPALLAAGGVFGFGMGGIVPLWGSLVGDSFGRHAFGRVMGLMGPCMLPLQTTGIPFAGYIYDVRGAYTVAFIAFIGAYVLACAILIFQQPTEEKF